MRKNILFILMLIASIPSLDGCATAFVSTLGVKAKYGSVPIQQGQQNQVDIYSADVFSGENGIGIPYVFSHGKQKEFVGKYPYLEERDKQGNLVAIQTKIGHFNVVQENKGQNKVVMHDVIDVERFDRKPLGYAAQILQVIAIPIDVVGGCIFAITYWISEATGP